jgi:hypothetical protein
MVNLLLRSTLVLALLFWRCAMVNLLLRSTLVLALLFGLLRIDSLVGVKGEARGWFRRTPRPLFELRELELEDGQIIKTYVYPLGEFANYAILALGMLALVAQAAALVM